jgi:hypothetical protein
MAAAMYQSASPSDPAGQEAADAGGFQPPPDGGPAQESKSGSDDIIDADFEVKDSK